MDTEQKPDILFGAFCSALEKIREKAHRTSELVHEPFITLADAEQALNQTLEEYGVLSQILEEYGPEQRNAKTPDAPS